MFIDPAFVPLVEQLQNRLTTVEQFVVLTDAAHMPGTGLKDAIDYESFIASQPDTFEWPRLEESTASALC